MVLVKTFPAAGLPALVSVKPLLESTPIVKVDTSAAASKAKTLTRYVVPEVRFAVNVSGTDDVAAEAVVVVLTGQAAPVNN